MSGELRFDSGSYSASPIGASPDGWFVPSGMEPPKLAALRLSDLVAVVLESTTYIDIPVTLTYYLRSGHSVPVVYRNQDDLTNDLADLSLRWLSPPVTGEDPTSPIGPDSPGGGTGY
jgi:hypothetical protein